MVRESIKRVAEHVTLGSVCTMDHIAVKGVKMSVTFQVRKQDLIRDAIFEAAIDLFARVLAADFSCLKKSSFTLLRVSGKPKIFKGFFLLTK